MTVAKSKKSSSSKEPIVKVQESGAKTTAICPKCAGGFQDGQVKIVYANKRYHTECFEKDVEMKAALINRYKSFKNAPGYEDLDPEHKKQLDALDLEVSGGEEEGTAE